MKYHAALRKILSLTLSLCLVFGLAAPGLAATYEVSNAQQMSDSWNAANSNRDASNTFNMTQNIDMGGTTLNAMDNKSYTIKSKDDGDYTLSNVSIAEGKGTFSGDDPQVAIQADITDNNKKNSEAALQITGEVNVVVEGDITVKADGGNQTNALAVSDKAAVTVMGDISSKDNGVSVSDSTVSIYGDVEVTGSEITESALDFAVSADDNAQVTISGNVDSTKGAANLTDGAGVLVKGDLSSDNQHIYGDINIDNGSAMWVEGDADIGWGDIKINNWSSLTVEGSVESSSEVFVWDHSTLKIDEDLNSLLDVDVAKSDLRVSGDVTTGTFGAVGDADVSIGGDLTALGDEVRPDDVYSMESSKISVEGKITTGQIYVETDSSLEAGQIDANWIAVGYYEEEDSSSARVHGDLKANLEAEGKSNVVVQGNVRGNVTARDSAEVEVWLDITKKVNVYDKAVVREHLNSQKYDESITYYVKTGDVSDEDLVDLCKGYAENSRMKHHVDDLRNAMISASTQLLPHLNAGNGTVIAILEMFDIAADEAEGLLKQYQYEWEDIHPDSRSRFENTIRINDYMVETHKKTLAKALQDLSKDPDAVKSVEASDTINKLADKFFGFITGIGESVMSAEEQAAIKKALENGIFSDAEAREYLLKFGGYVEGQHGIGKATKDLRAMVESMESVTKATKAVGYALTAAEFINFYNKNYTSQVAVLDSMLENTAMDPEMLIAVSELRKEYENKLTGEMQLLVETGKDLGADKVKDMLTSVNPILKIANVAVELLDTAGAFDKQHEINDASSLMCSAPSAIEAYEQAILRVQKGDTSDEALNLVRMTFAYAQNSVGELCRAMSVLGNSSEKETFEKLKMEVDLLKPGEEITHDSGSVMTAENFEEFYRNNIDPDAPKYHYA